MLHACACEGYQLTSMSANGCIAQGLVVGGVCLLEHHSTQVECLREGTQHRMTSGAEKTLKSLLHLSLIPRSSLTHPSLIPHSPITHPSLTPPSSSLISPHPVPQLAPHSQNIPIPVPPLSPRPPRHSPSLPPCLLTSPSFSHLIEESVGPEF